jgi:alcohol dehydrogenase class IV
MLPTALRVNQYACQKDLSSLAHLLYRQGRDTTSPRRAIGIMIERIERLCDEVGVPRRLSELGVTREQIPAIVASSRGSSMSGSPVQISDQDLADHLEAIL